MKFQTKKQVQYEKCRLEYLLNKRTLELDTVKEALTGEREVNSLCAAIIIYLMSKLSPPENGESTLELDKSAVNSFVGKYFARTEDGGDTYKVTLSERADTGMSSQETAQADTEECMCECADTEERMNESKQ